MTACSPCVPLRETIYCRLNTHDIRDKQGDTFEDVEKWETALNEVKDSSVKRMSESSWIREINRNEVRRSLPFS